MNLRVKKLISKYPIETFFVMAIFPITTLGNILLVGFAIFAIISDRMWRKLPKDHPAVYKDSNNNL